MKKELLILTLILLASVLIYGASGCSKQYSQGTQGGEGTEQSGMPVPGSGTSDTEVNPEEGDSAIGLPEGSKEYTIEITSAGFSPNRLTINAGDRVTFINKDTKGHWPASNDHPTHTKYPGSGIGRCFGGEDVADNFDACRALQEGESWPFAFFEKGVWGYHDHRASSLTGSIEVV